SYHDTTKINISFKNYCQHLIYKFFLWNSSYKNTLKTKLKNQKILEHTKRKLSNEGYDYMLSIRPDLFPSEVLTLLKQNTKNKSIGYQWNGLNRFPDTLELIPLFDNFFVFDHHDLHDPEYKKYCLKGITNFYFDMYQPQPVKHNGIIAYFVGLHFDERVNTINICIDALIKKNINLDFNIKFRKSNKDCKYKYPNKQINFLEKNINFDENIQHINQADILIDVVNPIHHGLSFRTFEALYYQKKLITNNLLVRHYDFYHPNNILVWDGLDLSELSDFLAKPWIAIDAKIIQKYSFDNWIKNILSLQTDSIITLPDPSIMLP
ncbi:hypothetical protein, partial [Acinetobacter qingfengensis]